MLVLAHRGLHAEVPENTIEAFRCAVTVGCDGIETDLRVAADGEVLLFHDRLAPDGTPVEALSRRALSGLVGYAVPSLAEALEAEPETLWNLEIKTRATVPPTLRLLRPLRGRRRVLCTSFIHAAVVELVEALGVEGGFLVAHDPLRGAAELGLHPRVRRLVFDVTTVSGETLQSAADARIATMVYGVVDAADHGIALRYGVAGIITDAPERLPR